MGDDLAAPEAGVEDQSVAVGDGLGIRQRAGRDDERGQSLRVVGRHLRGVAVVRGRHQQDMGRSLRIDVAERHDVVVPVHLVCRNLPGNNLAEQTVIAVVRHVGQLNCARVDSPEDVTRSPCNGERSTEGDRARHEAVDADAIEVVREIRASRAERAETIERAVES